MHWFIEIDWWWLKLTQGKYSSLDLDDLEWARKKKWHAKKDSKTGKFYARRTDRSTGKIRTINLHSVIMGEPKGMDVDHIFPELTLDNRRSNLRKATRMQNCWNRGLRKNCKSGYTGVYRHGSKWAASVMASGRRYYLGVFESPELAALARDVKAKELHGDFARINIAA